MSNYNYLKIDFYGQFNADTIHKLTYPEPFNPMGSATQVWLNPITDPRVIRTLFPMAKYGYRIHRDNNGTYYSYISKYERDARQGYVAITVMIGAHYESLINGQTIFNLLNMLKTNVLDTDNITPFAVEQCLIACQMPIKNVPAMSISPVQARTAQALRLYSNNEELYDIFQFPKQKEYDQYGEVFLINKLWCNNMVPTVTLLTNPIIKTYNVTKPANVSCESVIQTGKTLNISYSKQGYAPILIPITITGVNNQYIKYEGSKITVLTPHDLPFKQRVSIKVRLNGTNYTDNDKVNATIGNEPLRYLQQIGAYSAEVTQDILSEGNIRLSVNIDDPKVSRTNGFMKWLIPICTFLAGAAIAAAVMWFIMRDTEEQSGDNNGAKPEQVTNNAPNDTISNNKAPKEKTEDTKTQEKKIQKNETINPPDNNNRPIINDDDDDIPRGIRENPNQHNNHQPLNPEKIKNNRQVNPVNPGSPGNSVNQESQKQRKANPNDLTSP